MWERVGTKFRQAEKRRFEKSVGYILASALTTLFAFLTLSSNAEAVQPQIAAAGFQTLGLKSDGTVVAAGNNHMDTMNVGSWTDIIQVSAGYYCSLGLKSDGTVLAAGNNSYGQLNVGSWIDIIQVVAGEYHTLGLKPDGTVVAAGNNNGWGQTNVGFWTDIIQVAAGAFHSVGLRSDGTVVAAGSNNYNGQSNVGSWTDITQVVAGIFDTVGLKSDGTVVAAGDNRYGQLNVGSWTNIVHVAAGYYHTVGLKSDGTVVAIGHNGEGQLNVGSWSDIIQIASNGYHTVGLKSDGTVVATGWNAAGQCDVSDWDLDEANNQPPSANAGAGQTAHVGSAVSLDGSLSFDPDGDYPLSYAWSIVSAPSGSAASLNNLDIVNPTFIADLPGNYIFQLTVTDSKGTPSAPSQVVISTINTPPVADAGADQFATVIGSTVTLDGGGSYDNDGDDITYQWRIVTTPVGSNATLSDPTSVKPTFTADVHGDYIIELSVRDFWSSSNTSRTMVGFNNINPVAIAGINQSATIGDTIYLDGSGSYDANGDSLTYLWTIAGRPQESQAVLTSPNESQNSFVPDLAGQYVLNLVVNDGLVDSNVSVVNISVITVQDAATATLQTTISTINNIQVDLFNNSNNRNTLTNKINAVLVNIESGNYEDALSQLTNDVLGKTDGCATIGVPDKNDWITAKDKNPTEEEIQSACQAQGEAYSIIMRAIDFLEGLL